MELRSIKLQVSLIWTLIPAGGNEREALRALIRALYKLVPKFPMRYLVGDRAYGNDTRLIEWLDRCYGIVGVFPLHANIRKDLSYSKTGGVPKCRHGWARHLGVRNEWAPERRWEMGLAPGVPAPGVPSHRWQCPAGQKCPEIRGTSAGEDWSCSTRCHTPASVASPHAARRSAAIETPRNPESRRRSTAASGPIGHPDFGFAVMTRHAGSCRLHAYARRPPDSRTQMAHMSAL
jgi:hypothetical protein